MSVRDLIPWGRGGNQAPSVYRDNQAEPFLTLHREMNRLFDEAFFERRIPITAETRH